MKTKESKNIFKEAGLILFLSLSLGGCQVENKNQISMPEKPYVLKHDAKTLSLKFCGYSSKLSETETELLLSSLKPSGPGKASVHITFPSHKGSPLAKRRLKYIIRTLLEAGIKEKRIHKDSKLPPPRNQSIELVLDTYRAIPPVCPNWSMAYGSSYDRGRTSNFGCATAVNFLLMIEDPIVLFKGENAPSRDAARDSLSISDHRAGKDKGKWLKVETGTSSSSNTGGGSNTPGAGGQQQ